MSTTLYSCPTCFEEYEGSDMSPFLRKQFKAADAKDATIAALVEALEEFIPADSTAHAYDKARAALKAAKESAR